MQYVFNKKQVIINFSEKFCKTEVEILSSDCFRDVLEAFIERSYKKNNQINLAIFNLFDRTTVVSDIVVLFKHLLSFSIEEIIFHEEKYKEALKLKDNLYELVQNLYNFWRKLERFSLTYSKSTYEGLDAQSFIEAQSKFNELVLKTYRCISEKLFGKNFSIYRQLPAGVNASLMLSKNKWMAKNSSYSFLESCNAIEQILIRPPFIVYTSKNKRTGVYQETKKNPLKEIAKDFEATDYYCYQAMVGSALTYVYFHRDYLAMGISICNLFEFVPVSVAKNKKPDCVYIIGANIKGDSIFYYDKENDIYLGVAPHNDTIDYFGYVKKMMLTLYNIKMIKKGNLPLHGACVKLTLANGTSKTIVIVGDSGAGKSESLEALSNIAGDKIVSSSTIFDDMGTLSIVDNEIRAYGTEIGAFVRTDDMSSGYAYKEMDRAIFINPDRPNSRLIIPVNTYPAIMKGYKVDLFLYANNYEREVTEGVGIFDNIEEAKRTFIEGARFAKGTTQEMGLVKSFFANPFGPVQKEKETRKLIDLYFAKLQKDGVILGTLYTRLAVMGMEHDGPEFAAKDLLKLIEK